MCGIAGYSGQLQDSVFHQMVDLLNHRGPDDLGTFIDKSQSVGLGHTRLSILDLTDAGHQPMLSSAGDVVLVFNGEIYNYNELKADLISHGCSFRGHSDTEVLLQSYLTYGVEMLDKLNGIFAFAIWDGRHDSLFLARDALGVKPLYYFHSDSLFLFASELKAFSSPLPNKNCLDVQALNLYLSYLWCPGERTPNLEIRKLCPGEAMLVTGSCIIRRWTWYKLPAMRPSLKLFNKRDSISGTLSHLRTAVHRQMVSDVPLGAFLSGGLDSSSIVALARECNPNIQCFTIRTNGLDDEGFSDDLPYALEVASHLNVPLEVVEVDAGNIGSDIESMVWQLDEPLADPAPLNVFYISRLAREKGIKVLLSGAGGDDLFTGYRRHLALRYERFWSWMPRPVRKQLRSFTNHLPASYSLSRRLRKAFSGAHLNGEARLVNYFRWIDRVDLQALYTPGFRAALSDDQAQDPMLSFLSELPKTTSPMERMLGLEQRFFLVDHNLTYTDKMSMAAGVEVRVPFLDLDLVDFASRIPSKFKQCGRSGKWVLKKAMEPYLPHDVIYRPKSGFGVPLRRWLRVELRDWLSDTLSPDRLQQRGLFDPLAVQCLIAANAEGKVDASYTLLSLACIEIWCKYFIDGVPAPNFNSHTAD